MSLLVPTDMCTVVDRAPETRLPTYLSIYKNNSTLYTETGQKKKKKHPPRSSAQLNPNSSLPPLPPIDEKSHLPRAGH